MKKGRIHFKYHYPSLDFDGRRKIWKNLLNSTNFSNLKFSDEDLAELARRPLNGREVRIGSTFRETIG